MKVDLATAPTDPGRRVIPCTLGPWLLEVDEAQRPDVLAVIYGKASHAEVGRWLTRNGMDGNTQQIVGRHRDKPCTWCRQNGLTL